MGYTGGTVIRSFRHKGLERLFLDGTKKGVLPRHARKLTDILDRLEAAATANDMAYPGSGLHPLKGPLKGNWAVTVSGNWRVTFRFENGDAHAVDYLDYH
jgi:proteic killer suppression protein